MDETITALKARSFFGLLSIRTGMFIISFVQILTGVSLYFAFQYLRPSLHMTMWFLSVGFALSAVLGMWGAWKRHQVVEIIYFVTFITCLIYLVLSVLDFADVVQLMPKAPVGASESLFLSHKDYLHAGFGTQRVRHMSQRRFAAFHESSVFTAAKPEKGNAEKAAEKIYEELPFVPHSETEGQSEEISKEELPPEVQNLSPESRAQIIAITKMQKRPMKLITAGIFGLLTLIYFYFTWIILTFILNKCKSLDELTGQPEQFAPLVRDDTINSNQT